MNKRDKSEERKLKFQDCKTALLDANTVHTRVDEAIQQVGLHNQNQRSRQHSGS